MKKFLIRHLGNMGDHIFFIPPVLATLKRVYPGCHITLVTAWGYKDNKNRWGLRNQGGFCLHLMMTNPHVDQLIHWHDIKLSLEATICKEDGQRFPTWSKTYYEQQKVSRNYDGIYELDFGLMYTDNPVQRMYEAIGLPEETYSDYKIYFTENDHAIAQSVMGRTLQPRIIFLEGLESESTRGWDPEKISQLKRAIHKKYQVEPIWFGSRHVPEFEGRPLSLRENIATLALSDVGIGVMSGPMHFAAAAGLPTLALYADQPLHRVAPACFLNQYISKPKKYHRTLLGPDQRPYTLLKSNQPDRNLTPAEAIEQKFQSWQHPGRQSTKTGLAAITVDEVMLVLNDML